MLDLMRLDCSEDLDYSLEEARYGKRVLEEITIEGCSFSTLCIPPNDELTLYSEGEEVRILIFYSGRCSVEYSSKRLDIEEVALLVQHPQEPLIVHSTGGAICILELLLKLEHEDMTSMKNSDIAGTGLFRYSESPAYSEDIKSSKTVSRTLLPGDVVPRISIGSVYTVGEDEVAEHSHPMLEQYFLSLQDNESSLLIDGEETPFSNCTIVHIPLGSTHGVSVEKGKTLHYLWIDIFNDVNEMTYLEAHHTPLEPSEIK